MSNAGISRHFAGAPMPRHRHAEPYVAVVLAGGYVEAGDAGRVRARAGDVLIHGSFDAHQDVFNRAGAIVLNLPVGRDATPGYGRVDDIDSIARLAERDPRSAAERACADLRRGGELLDDWPDMLAAELGRRGHFELRGWARQKGLSPASVSRGFARAYGVTPQRFRAEQRARRAVIALRETLTPLADLSAVLGFADQAHMSRAVSGLTGHPPRAWRANCVQESRSDRA